MSADDISFQGIINIPIIPVISPPVLKLMYLGAKLAKSLAGLTTFAAIFTEIVAIAIPKRESNAIKNLITEFYINGYSIPVGGVDDVSCDSI